MHKPKPILNRHRFARLLAWAQAMLAWAAVVLLSLEAGAGRRRIRQRYRFMSLDWMERQVRSFAIVRAIEIARLPPAVRRMRRNSAPSGFRRRISRCVDFRAIAGSRFRKALKHRDVAQRLQRLTAALADIDAFVRRYLVPRAKRRLTRLCPVIPFAPPAEAIAAYAAAEPSAPNSS